MWTSFLGRLLLCIDSFRSLVSRPAADVRVGGDRDDIEVAGTRRRQKTHGKMKYRGSTSGAVISESVVARRSISTVEVGGDPSSASASVIPSLCADVFLLVLG